VQAMLPYGFPVHQFNLMTLKTNSTFYLNVLYMHTLEDIMIQNTYTPIQICLNISLLCQVEIFQYLKILHCFVINLLS